MKKMSLRIALIVGIIVMFIGLGYIPNVIYAGDRSARTMDIQSDPARARRNAWNLIPMLHNEVCYDIDSLFNYTGGISSDSLYKLRTKVQRLRPDSVLGVSYITGNPIVDSLDLQTLRVRNTIIDSIAIIDGSTDTLVISVGAKTWKIDMTVDQ